MKSFQIGHCINCGSPAMIFNRKGIQIGGMEGTKLCWLTLSDEHGTVKTRIGTVPICASCDIATIDPVEVKEALCAAPNSGVTADAREFELYPKLGLEELSTFHTKNSRL